MVLQKVVVTAVYHRAYLTIFYVTLLTKEKSCHTSLLLLTKYHVSFQLAVQHDEPDCLHPTGEHHRGRHRQHRQLPAQDRDGLRHPALLGRQRAGPTVSPLRVPHHTCR